MILMSFKDVRIKVSCVIYFFFFFFSQSTNVTGAAVRPVNPRPRRMRFGCVRRSISNEADGFNDSLQLDWDFTMWMELKVL